MSMAFPVEESISEMTKDDSRPWHTDNQESPMKFSRLLQSDIVNADTFHPSSSATIMTNYFFNISDPRSQTEESLGNGDYVYEEEETTYSSTMVFNMMFTTDMINIIFNIIIIILSLVLHCYFRRKGFHNTPRTQRSPVTTSGTLPKTNSSKKGNSSSSTTNLSYPFYAYQTTRSVLILFVLFLWSLYTAESIIRLIYSTVNYSISNSETPTHTIIQRLLSCLALISPIVCFMAVVFVLFLLSSRGIDPNTATKNRLAIEYLPPSLLAIFLWICHLYYGISKIYEFATVYLPFTAVAPSLIIAVSTVNFILLTVEFVFVLRISKYMTISSKKGHYGVQTTTILTDPNSKRRTPDANQTGCADAISFLPTGENDVLERSNDVVDLSSVEDPSTGTHPTSSSNKQRFNQGVLTFQHHQSSFLSRLTFTWYIDILRTGWKKPLEYSDFGRIPEEESCKAQHDHFSKVYLDLKQKQDNPSLWTVYRKAYWKPLVLGGILKFLGDAVNIIGPLVISPIVHFVKNVTENTWQLNGQFIEQEYFVFWLEFLKNGWVLAWLALVASLLQGTFSQASSHLLAMEGIHVRSALQTLVYEKCLKLKAVGNCSDNSNNENEDTDDSSADGEGGADSAEVINLTSEDSENIMCFFLHCHYIWAIPLKVIALIGILWNQLGISAIYSSLATILILIPLQFLIAKFIVSTNKEFVNAADKRLKITHEIITFIRSIKVNVWEDIFMKKLNDAREIELSLLLKDSLLRAFMTFLTQASGIIIILLAFGFFGFLEKEAPDEGIVFSSLALFSQLTIPLFILPMIVAYSIKAHRSTSRLQKFLAKSEIIEKRPLLFEPVTDNSTRKHLDHKYLEDSFEINKTTEATAIRISNGYFQISNEDHNSITLKKINLNIVKGKLTIIIGNVGSGKTSLLLAMLKEIPLINGTMKNNWNCPIACVSQTPWLLNRTLKENITLFKNLHRQKYEKVIKACALKPDIKILPDGDETEIGERGINLSGGQRQRVAIARAMYANLPIVFMDCPFSALDSAVTDHVFHRGVREFLLNHRHSTIVLTTQHQHLCQHADNIIYLEDQKIKYHGSPQELLTKYPLVYKKWITPMNSQPDRNSNTTHRERKTLKRQVTKMSLQYSCNKNAKTSSQIEEDNFSYLRSMRRKQSFVKNSPFQSLITAEEIESLHTVATFKRRKKKINYSKVAAKRTNSSGPAFGRDEEITPLRETSPFTRKTAHSLPPRRSPSNFEVEEKPKPPVTKRNSNLLFKTFSSTSLLKKKPAMQKQGSKFSIKRFFSREEDREEFSEDDEDMELYEAIIDDEERERGRISKWNYFVYLKACGLGIGILYLIFSILNQCIAILTDLWLGQWSTDKVEASALSTNNTNMFDSCDMSWSFMKLGDDLNCESEIEVSFYLAIFAFLSGLAVLFGLIIILLAQVAAHKGRRELHQQLLKSIIESKIKFFDITPLGRIINRFSSDISMIDKEIGWAIMHLIYFSLLCSSAIIINTIISPIFIIVTIPICLAYYMVQHIFRCSSRELKRLESLSRSPIFGLITETVSNPVEIRSYQMQDNFKSFYFRSLDSYLCVSTLLHSGNRWLGISLDYMGSVIVFLSTIACLFGSTTGTIAPARVGLAIKYTLAIPVYLNWLVRFLSDTEIGLNSVERIRQYCELPKETQEDNNNLPLIKKLSSPKRAMKKSESFIFSSRLSKPPSTFGPNGEIKFENISLFYDKSKGAVVSNLSLVVPPGQKLSVCGRTGSGKSSLILGILRMIETQQGCISLNGVNVYEYSLKDLRNNLTVVLQEEAIFTGTFRFNLDPENKYDDTAIWDALSLVLMKDFVSTFSNKLESNISQGQMSSGQAQLIMIARVLLEKKSIVLLDEISANLDPITEKHIIKVLKEEMRTSTIMFISHNITTLLASDRIVLMQEGKLVEDGIPEQLLKDQQSQFSILLKAINQ